MLSSLRISHWYREVIIFYTFVDSVALEGNKACYKNKVLAGEPECLNAEDLLRGIISVLFEVMSD